MRLKEVPVEQAVGSPLAHDVTQIVPGRLKETAFRRGHVVREEDLERLRDMGRLHLYVLDLSRGEVHENDAAQELARLVAGQGLELSAPAEGKVNFRAAHDGLLKVNIRGTARLNAASQLSLSTLHTNQACQKGQLVASAKIIPLTVPRQSLERAGKIRDRKGPLIEIKPFLPLKVGAVITGSEILSGRVADGFDTFVGPRVVEYGARIFDKRLVGDDPLIMASIIQDMVEKGAELILITGGLSVDPDDRTRQGVRLSGAKQVFYGSPVLPGAMFLYARLGEIPIMGLPACVYYNNRTVFDLLLPRILAGEVLKKSEIYNMGHGGLCRLCEICSFPNCSFGKGSN